MESLPARICKLGKRLIVTGFCNRRRGEIFREWNRWKERYAASNGVGTVRELSRCGDRTVR